MLNVIRVETRAVFELYFHKIDVTVQLFLPTYPSSRFYNLVENIDLVFGDNFLKGELYGVMGIGGSGSMKGGDFTDMRVRFY